MVTPGVKGIKTSCFWFAEHMQCDARVDGRGQQSTDASMPRVARRTRIRTGTVRKRNLAVMRKRTYPSSEGRLQGYALWTDEYWRRPTHAIKMTHVFTRRSGHRSPFWLYAPGRAANTRSQVEVSLCKFMFFLVCAILPCAGETMLVFRGWCLASHVLGACVYEAL